MYIPCVHKRKLLTVFYVEGISFQIKIKFFVTDILIIIGGHRAQVG